MSARNKNNLGRGEVKIRILNTLINGDKYGWEIIKLIEEETNGKIVMKQPSLYSALNRMKQEDLVDDYWQDGDGGTKRHYYSITQKGRNYIGHEKEIEDNKKNDEDLFYSYSDDKENLIAQNNFEKENTNEEIIKDNENEILEKKQKNAEIFEQIKNQELSQRKNNYLNNTANDSAITKAQLENIYNNANADKTLVNLNSPTTEIESFEENFKTENEEENTNLDIFKDYLKVNENEEKVESVSIIENQLQTEPQRKEFVTITDPKINNNINITLKKANESNLQPKKQNETKRSFVSFNQMRKNAQIRQQNITKENEEKKEKEKNIFLQSTEKSERNEKKDKKLKDNYRASKHRRLRKQPYGKYRSVLISELKINLICFFIFLIINSVSFSVSIILTKNTTNFFAFLIGMGIITLIVIIDIIYNRKKKRYNRNINYTLPIVSTLIFIAVETLMTLFYFGKTNLYILSTLITTNLFIIPWLKVVLIKKLKLF